MGSETPLSQIADGVSEKRKLAQRYGKYIENNQVGVEVVEDYGL